MDRIRLVFYYPITVLPILQIMIPGNMFLIFTRLGLGNSASSSSERKQGHSAAAAVRQTTVHHFSTLYNSSTILYTPLQLIYNSSTTPLQLLYNCSTMRPPLQCITPLQLLNNCPLQLLYMIPHNVFWLGKPCIILRGRW